MGSSSSKIKLPRKSHRTSSTDSLKSAAPCAPAASSEATAAAMALKDLGNEHFKAGKFAEAELLYTQAIAHNPTDPKLFSNRALVRVKLELYEGAEQDGRKAIELYGPKNPSSMKSYYSLAQALLGLKHPVEALETAKHAYRICLEIRDSSSEVLSQFILRTKQAQWQSKETARLHELNRDLANLEELLEQQLERDLAELEARYANQEIGDIGRTEERAALRKEAEDRRRNVREVFHKAQPDADTMERVSPILSARVVFFTDHRALGGTRLSDRRHNL